VDALSKDKEAALREKDAALKDKQALYLTCKQQEDQVSRLNQQMRSLQLRDDAAQDGRARVEAQGEGGGGGAVAAGGRGRGPAGTGAAGGGSIGAEDEDILQSVIAQRTRRRTLLDSTAKPAPALASTYVAGGDAKGHVSSGAGAEATAGGISSMEIDSMQVRSGVQAVSHTLPIAPLLSTCLSLDLLRMWTPLRIAMACHLSPLHTHSGDRFRTRRL